MSASPFRQPDIPDVLPRGQHRLDREVVLASQRGRLLDAFVEEVAEKGYEAVTIADIVARAGTAKRTFYENFADKRECHLQAFVEGSSVLIADLVQVGDAATDPIGRIEVVVRAYLGGLMARPSFTMVFLSSATSGNDEVVEQWIRWIELLADGLVAWRTESRKEHPEVPPLTRSQAIAVVSAINELVRIQLRRGGIDAIADGADETVQLAKAFLTADVDSF